MKITNIDKFIKGWFILGKDMEPKIYESDIEVGYHQHKKGDFAERHFHAHSDEINLIVGGQCRFRFFAKDLKEYHDVILQPGEILTIEPYEIVEFHADEDCGVVIVKTKSVKGDKYVI